MGNKNTELGESSIPNKEHSSGERLLSLNSQQQGLAMNENRLQAIIDDLDAATHYFAGAAGDEVKSIHASLKAASNILVNLPSPIATPRSVEYLVLSIAANQFTVPLPTGKEIVRAVNSHEALVAALEEIKAASKREHADSKLDPIHAIASNALALANPKQDEEAG